MPNGTYVDSFKVVAMLFTFAMELMAFFAYKYCLWHSYTTRIFHVYLQSTSSLISRYSCCFCFLRYSSFSLSSVLFALFLSTGNPILHYLCTVHSLVFFCARLWIRLSTAIPLWLYFCIQHSLIETSFSIQLSSKLWEVLDALYIFRTLILNRFIITSCWVCLPADICICSKLELDSFFPVVVDHTLAPKLYTIILELNANKRTLVLNIFFCFWYAFAIDNIS